MFVPYFDLSTRMWRASVRRPVSIGALATTRTGCTKQLLPMACMNSSSVCRCRAGAKVHASVVADVGSYLAEAAQQIFSPTKSNNPPNWEGTGTGFSGKVSHHETARLRDLYSLLRQARIGIQGDALILHSCTCSVPQVVAKPCHIKAPAGCYSQMLKIIFLLLPLGHTGRLVYSLHLSLSGAHTSPGERLSKRIYHTPLLSTRDAHHARGPCYLSRLVTMSDIAQAAWTPAPLTTIPQPPMTMAPAPSSPRTASRSRAQSQTCASTSPPC